jgi:predicted transcriptional regulator
MQHKGEIVEKAVRQSGIPLTKLVKRLGKSRKWIYNAFENPQLSIDYILEIGNAIHYDFINEIKELSSNPILVSEPKPTNQDAEYWKNKYLHLLEEYKTLLEASNANK